MWVFMTHFLPCVIDKTDCKWVQRYRWQWQWRRK